MKNGANKFTDYTLSRDSYVAFDALTLKDFIVKRLTDEGTFSDQVYEGSNLASIVEIIAYSYHVLLFYLNNTAAESTFTQASIYENMNKIVNLVGYKPTGKQTSVCAIRAIASPGIADNSYLIRKYSYFLVDNIQYTFLQDYEFSKTETGQEEILDELNENVVLYQGTVQEYPVYIAAGDEFETLPIVVENIVEGDSRFISNGTISVYVKETNTNKFYEYNEAPNMYLASSSDRVYDLRLNENGNYEVKFGNGVFGKQLSENDEVYIYYLLSDGAAGVVSRGSIGGSLFTYTTELFETIYNDVKSINSPPPIDVLTSSLISFSNPANSTTIGEAETVEMIRERVPAIVSSNLRLVTARDYKVFLEKELNGIVSSIYVTSNKEFLFDYINYFYKISVDPTKTNRVLLNQVNFADSCDFNNVNVFCVPAFNLANDNEIPDFMSTSLKNLIIDVTDESKVIGVEVVPRDPVYVAFKIGITNRANYTVNVADACKLRILRDRNNYVQRDTLKSQIATIINNFFNPNNNKLGQEISITNLSAEILGIRGIKNIYTVNINENIVYDGISFIAWSPVHPNDDIRVVSQDITLPFYKFPYLMYPRTLINYIEIVDE
jgi:hypothetical protein